MMISRGHYIGRVVDQLGDLQNQLRLRGKLGLLDLNLFIENFFRDILNLLLDVDLRNLNSTRSNAPGLDLADAKRRIAFQVTAERSSQKVSDTLEKLNDEQKAAYDRVVVLIAGSKQGKYTVKTDPYPGFDSETDIWDLDDICRKLVDLDVQRLEAVYALVSREFLRVRTELEIPDEQGRYQTNLSDLAELMPKASFGDGTKFSEFSKANAVDALTPEEARNAVVALAECLSFVPRMTREFLVYMLEHRDKSKDGEQVFQYNFERLKRQFDKRTDVEGELLLLDEYDLVGIRDLKDRWDGMPVEPPLLVKFGNWKRLVDCVRFVESNDKVSLRRVLVERDFSEF